MRGLLKIKVRPYYLFQCDEVQGTDHLRTTIDTGIKIIEGMRGFTSGLAVPNYVIDLPQGGGKVTLQPNYMLAKTEKRYYLATTRVVSSHLTIRYQKNKQNRTCNPRYPRKPLILFSQR